MSDKETQSGGGDELRPLGGEAPPTPPPPPRPAPTAAPPPKPEQRYEVEPLPPAPGEEPFGTWESVKTIARQDPAYGALLGLGALGLLANLLSGNLFGVVLVLAVLWGLITFRWWGYLLAMFGAVVGGMLQLWGLLIILRKGAIGGAVSVAFALGVSVFTVAVLYTRRDRFD